MEGPLDPQHPGQDAGASQPEAQDDLHALLERLLGQGDVRPSAPGAGDDLWPDPLAATSTADEVSTIIPAPDTPTAVAELGFADSPVAASAEPLARAWEPVVVDPSATTTNVDDIHAAILASISVELQPIAAPVPTEPATTEVAAQAADVAAPAFVEPTIEALDAPLDLSVIETDLVAAVDHATAPDAFDTFDAFDFFDAVSDLAPVGEASTVDVPVEDHAFAPDDQATVADDALPAVDVQAAIEDHLTVVDVQPAIGDHGTAVDEPAPAVEAFVSLVEGVSDDEHSEAAFVLTPFEAIEADAAPEAPTDADALWAAAVPELGLEVAPLLDLEAVDIDPADELVALTGVVLPWPTQESKADAPSPHDLIEAALAGLHADLTSEPVEPLRTPDVAVSTAHVVFRLGTRTMAIALSAVSEIARPPKVTRLPHVPAWVLGIANLRGDIVSMLDLEGFLSSKPGKSSHEQRMLALRPAGDEVRTAVLVDGVDGIQAFEDARIARVTRGYDAEVAPYARGLYQLEDELVVVLDADRLLQSKPMRQFEDGAGAR
jgi:chemotaxis signal transduction protein